MLSISPKLVWKLIADGRQIPVVRIGRSVRIPAEAIDDLIERGQPLITAWQRPPTSALSVLAKWAAEFRAATGRC
jgi:excisionase family DNA binding protein